MEKELLKRAFDAGVEYQKQFECKLAESYDKPNFDEWHEKIVLPQANVIKSVCDTVKCVYCLDEGWVFPEKPCEHCNKQTVL